MRRLPHLKQFARAMEILVQYSGDEEAEVNPGGLDFYVGVPWDNLSQEHQDELCEMGWSLDDEGTCYQY